MIVSFSVDRTTSHSHPGNYMHLKYLLKEHQVPETAIKERFVCPKIKF